MVVEELKKKVDELNGIIDVSRIAIQAAKEKVKLFEKHAVAEKAKVIAEAVETSF